MNCNRLRRIAAQKAIFNKQSEARTEALAVAANACRCKECNEYLKRYAHRMLKEKFDPPPPSDYLAF